MRWCVLILLSGCASQDPWTKDDTAWQVIYTAALMTDAYQTTLIQDHPNIEESGAIARDILGANPGTGETWLYFTTVGITNWFIARALPEGWRRIWQVGNIARHGNAINNGIHIGIYKEPCTRNPCE